MFIRGHTHKNGVPQKGSETTIVSCSKMDTHKIHKSEIRSETIIIFVIFLLLQNELKDAVTNHPELKEKSIQEGDVFSMFVDQRRMDMFVV